MGLLLRGWAAAVLDKNTELAVVGPYAYTRNPLYLGSFVIGMGAVVAGGQPWFLPVLAVFFAWIYRKAMQSETEELEGAFGERYRRYCEAVPAVLPRLRPYRDRVDAGVDGAPDPAASNGSGDAKTVAGASEGAKVVAGGPTAPGGEGTDDRDPARRPSLRRYIHNREYEAAIGAVAAFMILMGRLLMWY